MKTIVSRRTFLKNSSIALIGTASAKLLLSAEKPRKRSIRKAIMYATIGFKGTVLEKFQAVKDAGFEGVEPMSHMDQGEVAKALEQTGLQAASVCCATHWKETLSDPNPATRERGVEGLKQALRDAKRYRATSVLLVPGVVRGDVTYEDCWKRSIAEIRKVIPFSEETGVKIAIENVWNNFITKPEQARDYLAEIGSPQVGWHFDIGNILRFGAPEEWIPVIGPHILKLHIKEFSKAKGFGVPFFEGDNHWPAIMAALDKVGYNGWGISEQPGDQTRDAASLREFSTRMDRIFSS